MKVRKDYITNSSSSSFIVSKKDICTYEEVLESVRKQSESIRKILKQNGSWIYTDNEELEEELKNKNIEKALELTITEIAESLYFFDSDTKLELEKWNVYADELSDEEGKLFDVIMMQIGTLFSCENMRIG